MMKFHIVKKGESMQTIANKYNMRLDELMQMNKQIAKSDLILPGMKIKIPFEKNVLNELTVSQEKTGSEKDLVRKTEQASETEKDNVIQTQNEKALSVSDRNLTPPHDPNVPKELPRIEEDESIMIDKEISLYDEDKQEQMLNDVFVSQQLYTPPTSDDMYTYHYQIPIENNDSREFTDKAASQIQPQQYQPQFVSPMNYSYGQNYYPNYYSQYPYNQYLNAYNQQWYYYNYPYYQPCGCSSKGYY